MIYNIPPIPRHALWTALLVMTVASGACSPSEPGPTIDVFAAASVADCVEDIGRQFEGSTGRRIRVTRGASGLLRQQIEFGAKCDVFIPADPQYADGLKSASAASSAQGRRVARNRLVLILRKDPPIHPDVDVHETPDAKIAEVLRTAGRIAIANPEHAPAGQRARQVLDALNIDATSDPRLVFGEDVRLTARYVAEAHAECAIVYQTDGLAFKDQLGGILLIPQSLHDAIEYDAFVMNDHGDASAFVDFVASDRAMDIWRQHGFDPVE